MPHLINKLIFTFNFNIFGTFNGTILFIKSFIYFFILFLNLAVSVLDTLVSRNNWSAKHIILGSKSISAGTSFKCSNNRTHCIHKQECCMNGNARVQHVCTSSCMQPDIHSCTDVPEAVTQLQYDILTGKLWN